MLDTLRLPVATRPAPPAAVTRARPAPVPSVDLELVVTDDPDVLHRIVRVASSTPYTLLTMRLGAPLAGRRQLRMSVADAEARFETLRKRLDRVVEVVKVKVVR